MPVRSAAPALVPTLVSVLVSVLCVASLAACATITGGTAADGGLPPGTPVFSAPPPRADCTRIDVAGLRALTTSEPSEPRRILTYADPAQPAQTWAGCVGPAEAAATPSPGGAPGGSTGGVAADGAPDAAGTRAVPEGSTGSVDWLVRYATSPEAGRAEPLSAGAVEDGANRTLVRSATLGDADVRVELGVHADDHVTLVLVTVFDPRTGLNGAECGLQGVAGDAADEAVSWCLRALAGQLVRRPVVQARPSGAATRPEARSRLIPPATPAR